MLERQKLHCEMQASAVYTQSWTSQVFVTVKDQLMFPEFQVEVKYLVGCFFLMFCLFVCFSVF